MTLSQLNPSHKTSFLIAFTYSTSSFSGFVSSNLRLTGALYFCPNPKFKPIALACPMCKYPFGSGGNLNLKSFESKPEDKSS